MGVVESLKWWQENTRDCKEKYIDVSDSILEHIPKNEYEYYRQITFISELCHHVTYRVWFKKPTKWEFIKMDMWDNFVTYGVSLMVLSPLICGLYGIIKDFIDKFL